jgi:hypothetical protein
MMRTAVGVWTFGVGALVCALLSGCGAASGGAATDDGQVGSVERALEQGPSDAVCLRLTVANETTQQKVIRTQALTPGAASKFTFTGLPLGQVGILGEAFNVACASITATTPFTWTSDLLTTVLTPDTTPALTLVLNKAAKANIGVDFDSGPQFEEIPTTFPATKIARAPDGSMVYTVGATRSVWRTTNAFTSSLVATLSPTDGVPYYIATTSNGSIVVVTDASKLVVYTAAGVLKGSLQLPFIPSGLVIDSAQNAWLGSIDSAQMIRIAAVGTATPPLLTPTFILPFPGISGVYVGVASDGVRVVSQDLNHMLSYSTAGALTLDRLIPVGLSDVVEASDKTLWGYFPQGQTLMQLPATGTGQLAQFPVLGDGSQSFLVGLISTSKGIFASQGGTELTQIRSGVVSFIPASTVSDIIGLASTADGRVWIADSGRPHLMVVTLP